MYGGQEDRNRMVQQRQAYADELKLQMQEKQRAKQREALKLKALEQKEWELELALVPQLEARKVVELRAARAWPVKVDRTCCV